MDDLVYRYKGNTNQLVYVDDTLNDLTYIEDIDDQTSYNYSYDEIGNLISDNAEGITAIDWNVYGKIRSISFSTKNNLEFGYNPMGQRIWKKEIFKDGTGSVTTYYSLDAAGKLLAAYTLQEAHDTELSTTTKRLFLNEFEIYGSSRIGMLTATQKLSEFTKAFEGEDPGTPEYEPSPDYLDLSFVLGNKRYEFTNHLGNVLAVLTDRPISIKEVTTNAVNHFKADIANLYDYYPFGMLIKDRTYSTESCSTVTTLTDNVMGSNLNMSGLNWSGIGAGYFLASKVYASSTSGDGAQHSFNLTHNGEEARITLGMMNLTNLGPGSSLTVRLIDSAGTQIASYTSAPGTMFYLVPTITFSATTCSTGYKLQFKINNGGIGQWAILSDYDINQDHVSQSQVCGEVDYRFGFNGMEKDNQIKGVGNSLDFGARIYDSRLGRWMSLDPLAQKYPDLSPYNFVENSPIIFIDPDGKKIIVHYVDGDGNAQSIEYKPGVGYVGDNEFVKNVFASLDEAALSSGGRKTILKVVNNKVITNIREIDETDPKGPTGPVTWWDKNTKEVEIRWNINKGEQVSLGGVASGKIYSAGRLLFHEVIHAKHHKNFFTRRLIDIRYAIKSKTWSHYEEKYTIKEENEVYHDPNNPDFDRENHKGRLRRSTTPPTDENYLDPNDTNRMPNLRPQTDDERENQNG